MDPFERLYSLLLGLLRPFLGLSGSLPEKVAEAIDGRRTAAAEAQSWSTAGRREDAALVWLHAASAGELAGAVPVIRLLRRERPALQIAITVSSPSGLSLARDVGADFAGYAPLDAPPDCDAMIGALRPEALVFVKVDVWPGLSRAAAGAGIPLGMINGTVRPDSSRLRSPTRQFLRSTYARLDAVGVVGRPDAEALQTLGVDPERIVVTGDAAFDQALARVEAGRASGRRRLPAVPEGLVRWIGGSTWPPDEAVLVEVAGRLASRVELVLVPHEPSPEAIERIAGLCRDVLGREPRILAELRDRADAAGPIGAGDAETQAPLVVDAVGLLADLYLEADLAHVGGAFDATGLHSVIEPAAAGLPVTFGPLHDRREADDLLERRAALVITAQDATERIEALIEDPEGMREMGEAGRRYVEESGDAAVASTRLVLELVDVGISRRRSRPG